MYTLACTTFSEYEIDLALILAKQLDLAPGPGGSRMSDFTETQRRFYREPFLSAFPKGEWTKCTVVALSSMCQIPLHVDHPQDVKGRRYHVPIQTSNDAWCFSDGSWQQLVLGRMYRMDPTRPHGAVNWGLETRLHLLVDVL